MSQALTRRVALPQAGFGPDSTWTWQQVCWVCGARILCPSHCTRVSARSMGCSCGTGKSSHAMTGRALWPSTRRCTISSLRWPRAQTTDRPYWKLRIHWSSHTLACPSPSLSALSLTTSTDPMPSAFCLTLAQSTAATRSAVGRSSTLSISIGAHSYLRPVAPAQHMHSPRLRATAISYSARLRAAWNAWFSHGLGRRGPCPAPTQVCVRSPLGGPVRVQVRKKMGVRGRRRQVRVQIW